MYLHTLEFLSPSTLRVYVIWCRSMGAYTRWRLETNVAHRSVSEIPTRRKLHDAAELTKSLARTEEYIAVKRDMNTARQQVRWPTYSIDNFRLRYPCYRHCRQLKY